MGDVLVATSHFIHDEADPLWRFSDAVMHRFCFLGWERRAEFIARYNGLVSPRVWGGGNYKHMAEDGTRQNLRRDPAAGG